MALTTQLAGRNIAPLQKNSRATAAERVSRLSRVLVRSQQSVQQQERAQTAGPPAVVTQSPPTAAPRPAEERQQSNARINVIAKSRWGNGIPPVMGAHLMSSGNLCPALGLYCAHVSAMYTIA